MAVHHHCFHHKVFVRIANYLDFASQFVLWHQPFIHLSVVSCQLNVSAASQPVSNRHDKVLSLRETERHFAAVIRGIHYFYSDDMTYIHAGDERNLLAEREKKPRFIQGRLSGLRQSESRISGLR